MTPLYKAFSYATSPNACTFRALDQVREVYGVRRILWDERAHAVQVEYDVSRLREDDVGALLTEAGLALQGEPLVAASYCFTNQAGNVTKAMSY